ncbi:para-aminobenzoate synthetase / 4-amino-4-deoxychorismate lyase [Desulfonatronum thiosulfatophilum]|uniref:Para-aminobenzoate synthetase / 4-amino-4-deoxychorismate lyase n=1 Tax=Desulfonatronum thiosulfatophilum TaxID=617002 RepID=A0A1G6A3N2_9BACT|nr:aminodeoxychorismate synthase component I [Desulfonatronum thiosulfatophilum]SDB03058.1 para-aminobenzoate synthetase / 4-amino-4-deoxychorismate lyase [Desulfonatronum thiosulfatophilum]
MNLADIQRIGDETNVAVLWDNRSGTWRVFRKPVHVVSASKDSEVGSCLARIEGRVGRHGLHAAGFLSYEASAAFDPAFRVRPDGDGFPLLWFGLYARVETVSSWPCRSMPSLPDWKPSITEQQYHGSLGAIREHLRVGNTYQVNFTFRLLTNFPHHPWDFFLSVCQARPAAYAAYVCLEDWAICCFSPEQFFVLDGEKIVSSPMKGTRGRGLTSRQDQDLAEELRSSAKDRAENVMITDMVRNDLGRIAVPGSVVVKDLFAVEKHATVWQMVSRVHAQTHEPLSRIFSALFPPASITGAPKAASMEIITELEDSPRRIYTGCIGHISHSPEAGLQAAFNVAIRTVLVDRRRKQAEYGVGGGIVWDSDEEGEYAECRIKAEVLHQRMPEFELLETMLWMPDQGYVLLERHLSRLEASAEYFEFSLDLSAVREALHGLAEKFVREPRMVRLLVDRSGRLKLEDLPPPPMPGKTPRLTLAKIPVNSKDLFLYHKTTHRAVYEQALGASPEVDDVLLFNEHGQVTESTRANVLAKLEGVLYTPPISCGLLAGTLRGHLLDQGQIVERILMPADLGRAEQLYLINSVRGMYRIDLMQAVLTS